MNDIVEQYKEVNMIFNRFISPTFVCCLAGALIYPSFLDFLYFFKLIRIFSYAWVIGVNWLIIVIFNHRFIGSVSIAQKRVKSVKSKF